MTTSWIAAFDLGVVNFAFIIVDVSIINKPVVILWENINVNDRNWFNILQNVNTVLFEYSDLFSLCDTCLVEKQMTRLNMKASKLSYHVMSFFNIIWPYIKVIEYSAANKTHTFTHTKMDKKARKQYCIDKTLDDLIRINDLDSLSILLCHKKMDDLSDVYQMVQTYLIKYY